MAYPKCGKCGNEVIIRSTPNSHVSVHTDNALTIYITCENCHSELEVHCAYNAIETITDVSGSA